MALERRRLQVLLHQFDFRLAVATLNRQCDKHDMVCQYGNPAYLAENCYI